jgi:hypothetical protein
MRIAVLNRGLRNIAASSLMLDVDPLSANIFRNSLWPLFLRSNDALSKIDTWQPSYSHVRLHGAIEDLVPMKIITTAAVVIFRPSDIGPHVMCR